MAPDAIAFYSGYVAWPIARLRQEIAQGRWRIVQGHAATEASSAVFLLVQYFPCSL